MDGTIDVLVFGGMQLEVSSGGFYPAVVHGTVRPTAANHPDSVLASTTESTAAAGAGHCGHHRISMPLFVRVRAESEIGCPAHRAELSVEIIAILRAELARLSKAEQVCF